MLIMLVILLRRMTKMNLLPSINLFCLRLSFELLFKLSNFILYSYGRFDLSSLRVAAMLEGLVGMALEHL